MKQYSFVLFLISIIFFSSCKTEDQEDVDTRLFEGSWYHETPDGTTIISFHHSIVYKDLVVNGVTEEHLEFGMIDSVSKTHIKINEKSCEYKISSNKLYLKDVIIRGEEDNEWIEFVLGDPIYGK